MNQALTHPAEKIRSALALLGKGNRSVREMRTLILGLESAMQAMPGHVTGEDPISKHHTKHHFTPGVYLRELFIPKGVVIIGKVHKIAHLVILSQGDLSMWAGDGMKRIRASTVTHSKPGAKRAFYAHEDSVLITVHPNPMDERDIAKIESRLVADTFDEAYLTSQRTFGDAIHFAGFSPEEVTAISENESDQIPFPEENSAVEIKPSPVHGKGMFATRDFSCGEIVALARKGEKRTPAGRYTNHSGNPNVAAHLLDNGDVELIAIRPVSSGEEILNDYYLSFKRTREKEAL